MAFPLFKIDDEVWVRRSVSITRGGDRHSVTYQGISIEKGTIVGIEQLDGEVLRRNEKVPTLFYYTVRFSNFMDGRPDVMGGTLESDIFPLRAHEKYFVSEE